MSYMQWLYPKSDYSILTLVIIIGFGSWFIVTLPIRWGYRIFVLLVYVPLIYAALVFYMILFLGIVFGVSRVG